MQLRVGQVMTRLSICLYAHNTIEDALALMREKKVPGLPLLTEQGHIQGMVSKDQILEKGLDAVAAADKAVNYLTTRFVPLKEDTLVEEVWDLPFELYPVLNSQDEITGVVSKYHLGLALFQHSELRRQELEAVFDSAHNGILAVNKQGIITSLNPAAEKPTRSTRAEAVGKFLTDVIIPTGLLEVVRSGVPAFGIKFQVGRRQYITNRTPILKNGEVIGAVGVFQDVSEIEKILQELYSVRHLNDQLKTIVDSSYDGIIICDDQGEILRCNPAVGRILGIGAAELVGKHFRDLVDKGLFSNNIIQMVKKESGPVNILERPYADHSLVITGNPVVDEEGEIGKIVINIRDMSELLILREALEESKQLSEKYQSEIVQLKNNIDPEFNLIVRSQAMENVLDLAQRVSKVDSPVVLIGERGVGKEEIARFIHQHSERKNAPFLKLNCGTVPEELLSQEIFGVKSGSGRKAGVLERAHMGTLFLEEIEQMPLSLQSRLLRVLQDKELSVENGPKALAADVRIIASSGQPLKELVDKGAFREDLFFCLNVVPIKIPPLRERKEDVIPLIHFFLKQNNKRYSLEKELAAEGIELMLNYKWTGNVREMANVIERLVVTAEGKVIKVKEVNDVLYEKEQDPLRMVAVAGVIPLKTAIDEVEHQLVSLAMEMYGTTVKAAEALGVNQSTVVRKLKKLKDAN